MMCMNDEVQILRSTPLFAGMQVQKLRMLAFTSERKRFAPGETIATKGEMTDFAYVIVCGTATIEPDSKDATGATPHIVGVGDVIGEMALLCQRPCRADVRALDDVEALRIQRDCYMRLVSECPKCTADTIRILGERLTHSVS